MCAVRASNSHELLRTVNMPRANAKQLMLTFSVLAGCLPAVCMCEIITRGGSVKGWGSESGSCERSIFRGVLGMLQRPDDTRPKYGESNWHSCAIHDCMSHMYMNSTNIEKQLRRCQHSCGCEVGRGGERLVGFLPQPCTTGMR